MNDDLGRKLDAIAANIAKQTFNPGGTNVAFQFKVKRQNHSLVFEHNGIRVKVGGFKLVNPQNWEHPAHPVIASGVRRYFYSADVDVRVYKSQGHRHIVLGFWYDRDSFLLHVLGDCWQQQLINALLHQIDIVCGYIAGNELLEKAEGKPRRYLEDYGVRVKEF